MTDATTCAHCGYPFQPGSDRVHISARQYHTSCVVQSSPGMVQAGARIAALEAAVLAAKVLLENAQDDDVEDAWKILDDAYFNRK